MSLFSDLLKKHVDNQKMSVRKLAEKLQIDRTLFQKYLSGARIPKNYNEVTKIGQELMLTSEQKELLLKRYHESIYGAKKYESFMAIKDVLEGTNDLRVETFSKNHAADTGSVFSVPEKSSRYYGKLQVEAALMQFIDENCRNGFSDKMLLRMIVQPTMESMIRPILLACKRNHVEIEHIFCMDCDRHNNENLSLLFSVFAFELSGLPYQSRYYYDEISSHLNKMSLVPNMLSIGECVFLCNYEADEGLILYDKEIVAYFDRRYADIRKYTEELVHVKPNIIKMADAIYTATESIQSIAWYSCTPCFTVALDEDILRSHLLMGKEETEYLIRQLNETKKNLLKDRVVIHSYFSEKGLVAFMETGRIPDYPDEIYRVPNLQTRICIVKRLLQAIKAGWQVYMTVQEKLNLCDKLTVYCHSSDGGVEFLLQEAGKRLVIDEPSISYSICEFERFARENDWFYGKEETIDRMEAIIKEYDK